MRRAYYEVALNCLPRHGTHRLLKTLFLLLACIGAVSATGGGLFAKSKPVSWKPITDALLSINDSPVKDWGVYQAGKKTDPLLLQMGNRFFLIEIHDRQLFELDPSKVQSKSEDLLWDPSDRPANPAPHVRMGGERYRRSFSNRRQN